ncbi:NACHT domain-containing protein [Candidatus Thiosymbion oneisti]|uniref:NACHT domain-containing protein n=1 Tax=Candidatus Thiosymbion oneisti TaxID=589554 RepID=UPI0013FE2CCA|nr:toll/interleukin-1 receptor domain-containing protein [Candidatus Thiosymbion oneisti]
MIPKENLGQPGVTVPNASEQLTFISYNRKDRELVTAIDARLREAGIATFLDTTNITADKGTWPDAIHDALENSPKAVVFIGPGGIGEVQDVEIQWLWARYAQDRSVRLIFALLPGASYSGAPPELRRLFPGVDLKDYPQHRDLTPLIRQLRADAPAPPSSLEDPSPHVQAGPLQRFWFLHQAAKRLLRGDLHPLPFPVESGTGSRSCFLHPFPLGIRGPDHQVIGSQSLLKSLRRLARAGQRVFVLVGEPGSGKTIALGHLAVGLAERHMRWFGLRAPFPILIRAGDLDPGAILAAEFSDLDALWPPRQLLDAPPVRLLHRLLTRRRAWLLVDGLDELGSPAQQAGLAEQLARLVYESVDSLLLITCRTPLPVLKELPPPATLTMVPLPLSDREGFRRWLVERGAGEAEIPVMEAPHQTWLRTPLELTLWARLAARGALPVGLYRADLYDRYLRWILRLDVDQRDPSDGQALLLGLASLAHGLHQGAAELPPLPEALRPPRSQGILEASDDEEDGPRWRFTHPSFQEYLAAEHLLHVQGTDLGAWVSTVWAQRPGCWSPVAVFITERLKGRRREAILQTMAEAIETARDPEAIHGLARCLLILPWEDNPSVVELARHIWMVAVSSLASAQPTADWPEPSKWLLAEPRLGPGLLLALTRPGRDWHDTFWVRARSEMTSDDPLWRAWIRLVARLPLWHPALPEVLEPETIPPRWRTQALCLLAEWDPGRALAHLETILEGDTDRGQPEVLYGDLALLLALGPDPTWPRLVAAAGEDGREATAGHLVRLGALLRPWWGRLQLPASRGTPRVRRYRRLAQAPFRREARELAQVRWAEVMRAGESLGIRGWDDLARLDRGALGEAWAEAAAPGAVEAAVLGRLLLRDLRNQGSDAPWSEAEPDALRAWVWLGWWLWEAGAPAVTGMVAEQGWAGLDLPAPIQAVLTPAILDPRSSMDAGGIDAFVACGDDRRRLEQAAHASAPTAEACARAGILLAGPESEAESAGLLDLLLGLPLP